jgi:transposase-like protein
MTINLTDPIFTDETAAREHLESLLWPNGPTCPRCGEREKIRKLVGKAQRPGLYQCNPCHRSFSVTVNTVMERSHIPLKAWVAAFHLYAASKKGFSAHQLHRMLGLTYKSAWFLAHRVRETMDRTDTPRMGGGGKAVEMDETFIGRDPAIPKTKSPYGHKNKVIALVERHGEARSFHVERVSREQVVKILFSNVSHDASLMTDESPIYKGVAKYVGSHDSVNHQDKEWVRDIVHTNSIEGFFSVFKRGMKGVYQHCGSQHLQRYLNEFDFRFSNRAALGVDDTTRAQRAIKAASGKRLTYNQTGEPKRPAGF